MQGNTLYRLDKSHLSEMKVNVTRSQYILVECSKDNYYVRVALLQWTTHYQRELYITKSMEQEEKKRRKKATKWQ